MVASHVLYLFAVLNSIKAQVWVRTKQNFFQGTGRVMQVRPVMIFCPHKWPLRLYQHSRLYSSIVLIYRFCSLIPCEHLFINTWCCICLQVGHTRRLHHHPPTACGQSETVYREHRGPGSRGQRAGQGKTHPSGSVTAHSPVLLSSAGFLSGPDLESRPVHTRGVAWNVSCHIPCSIM